MADVADDLELIPRAVRDKLDRVAIKVHLREWQLLSRECRQQLRDLPCDRDDEAARYATVLDDMIESVTGNRPQRLAHKANGAG